MIQNNSKSIVSSLTPPVKGMALFLYPNFGHDGHPHRKENDTHGKKKKEPAAIRQYPHTSI